MRARFFRVGCYPLENLLEILQKRRKVLTMGARVWYNGNSGIGCHLPMRFLSNRARKSGLALPRAEFHLFVPSWVFIGSPHCEKQGFICFFESSNSKTEVDKYATTFCMKVITITATSASKRYEFHSDKKWF